MASTLNERPVQSDIGSDKRLLKDDEMDAMSVLAIISILKTLLLPAIQKE